MGGGQGWGEKREPVREAERDVPPRVLSRVGEDPPSDMEGKPGSRPWVTGPRTGRMVLLREQKKRRCWA